MDTIKKQPLLVILGPTGVGKSRLALEIGSKIKGEIISGDSMQVYQDMNIGTAKVTEAEQALVPHHLLDIRKPNEDYSVMDFCEMAEPLISEIASRGHLPILAGGTGLYIQSLLENYQFSKVPPDLEYRKMLEEKAKKEGFDALYQELLKLDPESAARITPQNTRRVIRALESLRAGEAVSVLRSGELHYDTLVIGLEMDRPLLYDRINRRVDLMFEEGWVDECRELIQKWPHMSPGSCQAIGYKEIFAHLRGELTLEMTKEIIKQRTRNFAKRQITWFRRMDYIRWQKVSESTNFELLANQVIRIWEENLENIKKK